VYENPTSPEIAVSTGDAMILPAHQSVDGEVSYPLNEIGNLKSAGTKGYVVIRPEEVIVSQQSSVGMQAKLISLDYFGHDAMLTFSLSHTSELIKVRVAGHSGYSVGQTLSLTHEGPIRFFKE
jgi:iron(III) transport system ATP-binding protein